MFAKRTAAIALSLTLLLTASPSFAQAPAAASSVSQCAVSDDPDYGYTMAKPIQVGGGAMYAAARQRRFLGALRGPAGGPVSAKRLGARPQRPPNSVTFTDVYAVTYQGIETPVEIFLDAYHFDDEMKAPKGFTCAAPFELALPPPDAFQATDSIVKVAIEQGATREFAPIPLEPGSSARGVIFDRFRIVARQARAAAAAGTPLTPHSTELRRNRRYTVVVGYPMTCKGASIAPSAVDLTYTDGTRQRVTAPREDPFLSGRELVAALHGFEAPDGALAATWPFESLPPGYGVRVTYAAPCNGSTTMDFPVAFTPAKLMESPEPARPDGEAAKAFVRLQVLIDPAGTFQDAVLFGGPERLVAPAAAAVRTWRVEPKRLNGAPVVEPVTLLVRFK